MNILVIGSGGREHALVWKLSQSRHEPQLFCAPGNPGIALHASLVPLKSSDTAGLLQFALDHEIGLTVVGPEQPLADGLVDRFQEKGLAVFGPTQRAAELEWSKVFAKEFMSRHRIPTAGHLTFNAAEVDRARRHLEHCPLPVVLKADGLAAGKGVAVCQMRDEALEALHAMAEEQAFGKAGARIVVEEWMSGEEASVFAVCDGNRYQLLAPAQDHKRVFDGDRGKNTGGMGAYAPAPVVTPGLLGRIEREILVPTLRGMEAEGRPYRGCLYVGLMLTPDGPKVVEYNSRFGDPETQVVLPLYAGDLVDLLLSAARGDLQAAGPADTPGASAACVVLASHGYPEAYATGVPIQGLDAAAAMPGVFVFHAGTKQLGDAVVTAGGRVLGVTAFGEQSPLSATIALAYEAVAKIRFAGMHFRKDIGHRALLPHNT